MKAHSHTSMRINMNSVAEKKEYWFASDKHAQLAANALGVFIGVVDTSSGGLSNLTIYVPSWLPTDRVLTELRDTKMHIFGLQYTPGHWNALLLEKAVEFRRFIASAAESGKTNLVSVRRPLRNDASSDARVFPELRP